MLEAQRAFYLAVLRWFIEFDLGGEENAVLYREAPLHDEMCHQADNLRRHRQIFEQMWETALSPDESTRLITTCIAPMLPVVSRRGTANQPTVGSSREGIINGREIRL